uniref:protein-serine/threonine phosphatase n=1 Tax=Salix viminalis TaxID=40686 RepID=A0A6N2L900_SALVM
MGYTSVLQRGRNSQRKRKGRLRYGLSSMQGWRATMEDAHAAITDLDATTSFFGVYDGHGGKVVAKFSCKFLHQQVLKNEEHAAGDIGTSVQKAFFRLLDFITKEFFLSPSRIVVEVSSKPVAPAVPAIPSPQKPLPLTTRSNPDDLRRKTISLLEEYFSVQILDEALQCVEELKDPAFHPEVTKEAISLALEKSPPCVGPVIKLLEFLLTKKVLTARDIGTGLDFEVLKELLEKLEDNRFRKAIFEEHQLQGKKWWQHSSPKKEKFSEDGGNGRLRYGLSSMQGWRATMEDAPNSTCSKLRLSGVRLSVMECVSSKVVAKFCSKFLHQQVLKKEAYAAGDIGTSVQKAFFRSHSLLLQSDDLRRKTISLLEEYFSVQILDEALQCVEELKDPAFHPEVTISLALEKSPPCVGPVIKLLEFLLTKKVLTARDIGTGLDFEVLKELLEKLEDNKFRKAIFEEHQLKPFRARSVGNTVMGIYLSSPKKEKFSEDGGNGRLRYGLSSMQGWRATMEDAHAAIIDLDATTSFFGVIIAMESDFIVSLADLWLCPYMNKVKVIAAMFNSTGDIGTSVQKAFFRMDEMMRGQRSWRELAALGDKINKFTGMIEGLIWSPRCGGSNEQPDDWAFEEIDEHVQREIRNHSSLKHPNIIIFKEHQLKPFRARSGGNTVLQRGRNSQRKAGKVGLDCLSSWRATMEDAHAAITDLDATTSFFGVYDAMESDFIVFLADLCLCPYMNKVKVIAAMFNSISSPAVLKNEEHAAGDIGTSVQKAFFRLLDFITKEFFLSPSRIVVEVSIVIIALDVEIKSRNHENEKLLKGLDVMKSVLHSAPSLNTRLLPQGSAGVLDGKTTLLQGGGTPSQPGFDTRDELIGQTPQPVAPAVPAIPSSQKPLPLTTSVQILDEALQCVEELKDPAFHPERYWNGCLLYGSLLDDNGIDLPKAPNNFGEDLGNLVVVQELLEKLEDNRFRKAIFEEHQLQGKKWWQHSSPKKEKFSEDGGNGRLRYGLSSMQGWRATMEDAHAAIIDLDATTSFFGVYNCHGGKNCKFQSDFIVSLADLWLCPYMNKVKVIAAMFNSTGDIGTSVQKAFFRMDEMMRGQRSWRELAALGDKINKFTGMIEGLIWSPRCGGSNEQPDDWAFEEYLDKWTYRHIVDMEKSHMSNSGSLPLDFLMRTIHMSTPTPTDTSIFVFMSMFVFVDAHILLGMPALVNAFICD